MFIHFNFIRVFIYICYDEFNLSTKLISSGAAVAEWLSSWLAEQEDWGSFPGLEIGYLLLPSRDMKDR